MNNIHLDDEVLDGNRKMLTKLLRYCDGDQDQAVSIYGADLMLRGLKEQTTKMYVLAPLTAISHILGVGLENVNLFIIVSWIFIISLVYYIRISISEYYSKKYKDLPCMFVRELYANLVTWTALLVGAAWGGAGAFVFLQDDFNSTLLVLSVITGTASISIVMYVYWINAFFAYAVTAFSIVIIVLLLDGVPQSYGLAILFICAFYILQKGAKESAVRVTQYLHIQFLRISALEKITQENTIKSRFVASASHDLRQPAYATRLYTEQLMGIIDKGRFVNYSEKNQTRKILHDLQTSVDSLTDLVHNLLDISRLEIHGGSEVNKKFITARVLMKEIENTFNNRFVIFRVYMKDVVLYSDPLLIKNVLHNFISNAIVYGEEKNVLVTCRKRPSEKRVWFDVWDQGPGIPEQKIDEIFEEYIRIDNASTGHTGLGLGLAISKKIAALLNGEIIVYSREGRGSMFRLSLPYNDEYSAADIPSLLMFDTTKATQVQTFADRSVLLIDDNPMVLQALSERLVFWGMAVITAVDESSAIDIVDEIGDVPELIISDYGVSNNRGFALANLLIEKSQLPVEALLITGNTQAHKEIANNINNIEILYKPIDESDLIGWISRSLEKIPTRL